MIAVQDIVQATAENDMSSVTEVSRAMGMGMGQGAGQAMGINQVLPMEFRQMARGTHMAFGELAQAAEFGSEGVMADLGALMSNCTGCHASYKIVAKP
ncbi:MAG: cytochrome c [Magnetovibrio sp.]|nr:cytochrome c [Magnetovibrio sp.]